MRILDMFRRPPAAASAGVTRDASDDRFFDDAPLGGVASEIGVAVTVERARRVPVVRDCMQVLSHSVGGLERGVFRRLDADTVQRVDDHPVLALLRQPNGRQTSFEFMQQLVEDVAAYGNFYAGLDYDARGRLTALHRLDPERVTLEETPDGQKRYRHRDRQGREAVYLEDEVWHIPLPPLVDNLRGRSPIMDDGREAVAVAIALQQYANTLFTNDATPPYVLAMDGHFEGEGDKENFLRAWQRWVTGRRRHSPGVLEYGMKPHRMGLTAEEAQFLETRKELWLDLTRIWRVPPHKVGIMDRATFSNIEHQSLEFVTDTLRPILELIEASVNRFLIGDPAYYFEFNVESLLRGDIKTRFEAYALGRQWGWFSVNDIRRKERMNSIGPAGDRYMEPLNMVPLGTGAAERQPEARAGIDKSIAFLRESVERNGGRPRLEVIRNAA